MKNRFCMAVMLIAAAIAIMPPDCQAGIFSRRVPVTPQYDTPATPVTPSIDDGQRVELPAPSGRWQLAVFIRDYSDQASARLCAELNDDARLRKLQEVADVTVYLEADPMYRARYAAAIGDALPAMWLTDPDGNPAYKVSGQNIPFGKLGNEVQRSLDLFAANQPAYALEQFSADCCRPRPKPTPPAPPVTTTQVSVVPDIRPTTATTEEQKPDAKTSWAGFGALAVVIVVVIGGAAGLALARRSIK